MFNFFYNKILKKKYLDLLSLIDSHPREKERTFLLIRTDFFNYLAANNFFSWKGILNESDLEKALNDSILVLNKHSINPPPELKNPNILASTYLVNVFKNKCKEINQKNIRYYLKENPSIEEIIQSYHGENILDIKYQKEYSKERWQRLRRHFKIKYPSSKCIQLLEFFFFREMTQESIAKKLGYKNVASVKSSKLECLKKMRNITC